MTTITRTVTLVDLSCCSCGLLFAVPERLKTQRQRDGGSFYCPNGHRQQFTVTEADRLREELERERRHRERAETRAIHYRDQADAADRSAAAYKGQATKLRKRVANGVCPCCRRSFAQLGRHMATKHPDYADGGG
jgi:hypothetical protein